MTIREEAQKSVEDGKRSVLVAQAACLLRNLELHQGYVNHINELLTQVDAGKRVESKFAYDGR